MKVTIKAFVHKCSYSNKFEVYPFDMSSNDTLFVGTCEFEYEVPAEWNPVAAEVAMLNQKLDELNDEHMKKTQAIKGRIQELLCIENNPTVQA